MQRGISELEKKVKYVVFFISLKKKRLLQCEIQKDVKFGEMWSLEISWKQAVLQERSCCKQRWVEITKMVRNILK